MSIVPRTIPELLSWANDHGNLWALAPTTIGLTAAQANAFKAAVSAASGNVAAASAANEAKKAATTTAQSSISALRNSASDVLATIKAFAESSSNPSAVYAAAQIPPPAPPSPIGPPGTPYEPVVTLRGDGAVIIKWKCNNPPNAVGTVYEVRRRIGGTGAFTYIGVAGVREFVDETLPLGADGVTYQIVGIRSTVRGNYAQFNVNFGINGPGFASVSSVKLAA